MKLKDMLDYGMEIYCRNGKLLEYRWIPVFMLRCLVHKKEADEMHNFFTANDMRQKALKLHYNFWAQLTRQLFYKNSKAKERLPIILNSWSFIESYFNDQALKQIYFSTEDRDPKAREKYNGRMVLWEKENEGTKPLSIEFGLIDGQMKEGCATISLFWGEDFIYHINFWFTEPDEKTGKPNVYIGAHQGSKEGLDANRDLTKLLFGCRPKNFIFIALQEFLKILGINKLYAVTNYGFYANNHLRLDRKLKVSYDDFWTECGGKPTEDKRFYELTLDQNRKSYEEIPTKKRAYYRKRYELLDEMVLQMKECIDKWRRK